MTRITIEMEPSDIDLRTGYGFDTWSEPEAEKPEFFRNISFQGQPQYGGTYEYMDIALIKSEQKIDLPNVFTVILIESKEEKKTIGHLTFLEKYSDEELGIREPDSFNAEIGCPTEQFDKIIDLVKNHSLGTLSVKLAIKAPKTELHGYAAIMEIGKHDSNQLPQWPIEQIVISIKNLVDE